MSTKTLLFAGAFFVLLKLAMPAVPALAVAESPAQSPAVEFLTLTAALERALQASPELTAYAEETRARAAEVAQAGRLLNPELSLEVANVAGSGPFRGFAAAETTLQLSQQIELGNKRQLRRGLAEAEHDRSLRELEMARLALQAEIARNFWQLLGAQEHLKLAEEEMAVATATLTLVEEKVAAGRAPSVERYRFQSALTEARLNREKAALALTTARQTLAAALGRETSTLGGVVGDLALLPRLPAAAEIEAQLEQSPESIRRQLESEAKRRALALARAEGTGDPTLALGLSNFSETDDNALLFGLSLPLPLFDRNQGNVLAARHRLAAAQAQEASGRQASRAGLTASWQALAAGVVEAQALREEIIPTAQETFAAASYGYQAGRFGVLEVQDAQRALIEVRERYLDVLLDAQLAGIELQQQLGQAPLVTNDQSVKE